MLSQTKSKEDRLEKKIMRELGFNLVGDSGKENTDNILACLASYSDVSEKTFQKI